MVSNICLFTVVLTLGQVGAPGWQLAPQLSRGQELVYHGWYKEKSLVPGVAYQRDYRLETRLLVLDALQDGWDAALLTALELIPQGQTSAPANKTWAKGSVRLQLVRINKQGQLDTQAKVDLTMPLEGPPTLEHGFIVPGAGARNKPKEEWTVAEPGRPGLIWTIGGAEVLAGTKCVKLTALQLTPNWKDKQVAGDAWQRIDQVWINPQLGVAMKVERELLWRDAARLQPTRAGTVRYDLDRQWTYPPGQLFENRRQEVLHAVKFATEAEQLLPDHVKHKSQLDLLVQRIKKHLQQNEPAEPYRQAFEQVLHRVEAVRKGEIKVDAQPVAPKPLIPVVKPGAQAPDFLVTDLATKKAVRLHDFLGRPILILFYNPHTETGQRTLEFAKKVNGQYKTEVQILGMAVTHKVAQAVAQQKEMGLPFPVLDGTGLHQTFAVDATPRLIVLDAEGLMQGAYTGWGFHVADQVLNDLKKCVGAKKLPSP